MRVAGLGSVAAWPVVGRAQQSSKIHRVAWVSASEPVADMNESSGDRGYRAFLEELRQLGSIEGRNLILERYSGDGRTERYSELANAVAGRLGMPMPEIDLESLREVPWAARRTVTPPAAR